MEYKGYRILLSNQRLLFYETNEDGECLEQVTGIDYQSLDSDYDMWFAVIDKDNFMCQSFDTIEEAKEYIEEQQ